MQNEHLRIIVFGAHPDDCEVFAGGTAALWAARGHHVKFVSTTNGDIGHFEMAGAPLARRRRAEVERCAEILGITTQVLDIHDGELMSSLENRRLIADLIRDWRADVVLCHRPWDYHADHRYTGILVQDASILLLAPFFSSKTEALERLPVILFMYDRFTKPYPFDPAIVVNIDAVTEKKWACLDAMPSQFAERGSWLANVLENVPDDDDGRKATILKFFQDLDRSVAERYRERLSDLYGQNSAAGVEYAEAFELCEYGRQPDKQELRALFPVA